jgi:hypothetical protein
MKKLFSNRLAGIALGLAIPFSSFAQWSTSPPGTSGVSAYNAANVGIRYPSGFNAPLPFSLNGDAVFTGGSSAATRRLIVDNMPDFTLIGGSSAPAFPSGLPGPTQSYNGTTLKIFGGSGTGPDGGIGGSILIEPGPGTDFLSTPGNIVCNQRNGAFLIGAGAISNPGFQRLIVGGGASSQLGGGRNNIGQWESGTFGASATDTDFWATLGGPGTIPNQAGQYGMRLNGGRQSLNFYLRKRPGNTSTITGVGDAFLQWSDNTATLGSTSGASNLIFNYRFGTSSGAGDKEIMRFIGDNGRVAVGCTTATAKVELEEGDNNINGTGAIIGLLSTIKGKAQKDRIAIYGLNDVLQDGGGPGLNIGVKGEAVGDITSGRNNSINIGVLGKVDKNQVTQRQIAVFGNAFGAEPGAVGTGIVGGNPGDNDNPDIDPNGSNGVRSMAGYFNGTLVATNVVQSSDAKFKTDVKDLNSGLQIISQLQPRTYNYKKTKEFAHIAFPRNDKPAAGFIAQELKEVLPNLVTPVFHPGEYDSDGKQTAATVDYLAVNYVGLTPYLVAAIQELNQKVEKLEKDNSTLRKGTTNPNATLSNSLKDGLVLEQSAPNPTAGRATINYQLPEKVSAVLIILDLNGRIVREYSLDAAASKVEVDLSANGKGMYIYTLAAAGYKPVSKTMILQ